jgi:hypothetical protein
VYLEAETQQAWVTDMVWLLGIVWAMCAITIGAMGASAWWIVALVAAGAALYTWLRSTTMLRGLQEKPLTTVLVVLATQAVIAGLLFGFGRLINFVFWTIGQ